MEQDQISLTAVMTSYMRGFHAMYDPVKIFDDFLAYIFLPEERRVIIEQNLLMAAQIDVAELAGLTPEQLAAVRRILIRMGASNVLSRAAYTETMLADAVRQGIKQYVILGAGMDTFALRHPEWAQDLCVYEVDHPAMQSFKRQRVEALGWKTKLSLRFVPVDFTRDDLAVSLGQAMFDSHLPGFFSWLGVAMYLSREEAWSTMAALAGMAAAGSMMVFDYLDNEVPGETAAHVRANLSQQVKEPIQSGFDPAALGAELDRLGWTLLENFDQAAIQQRYFQGRTDGYRAAGNHHLALAVRR